VHFVPFVAILILGLILFWPQEAQNPQKSSREVQRHDFAIMARQNLKVEWAGDRICRAGEAAVIFEHSETGSL